MAALLFTGVQALDLAQLFNAIKFGALTFSNAQRADYDLGGGRSVTLFGSFTAFDGLGRPTAGSITRADLADGADTARMTGIAIGVPAFDLFVENQDAAGLLAQLFAGADRLTGTAGADVLNGYGGNDVLYGLGGDDTLTGGGGIDTANYEAATGPVAVDLALATPQNTGGAGVDTLGGIENLIGSAFADTLAGDGGSNTINGMGGSDTMRGRGGDDFYRVDTPFTGGNTGDRIIENANEGMDTVRTSVSFSLAAFGANVENLVLLGSSAISGAGNDLDNRIRGNDAANILTGNGGNDILMGRDGADVFRPGLGRDRMYGGVDTDLDVFEFYDGSHTQRFAADMVFDFVSGIDKIDLTAIDARLGNIGDNAFAFSTEGPAAHSVWTVLAQNGTDMLVRGNVNGTSPSGLVHVEFEIRVVGVTSLVVGDLIL